jgi:hypothetical protein
LHFLSEDRPAGGHVLDLAGSTPKAQVQHLDDFRMAIPESPEFLKADLIGIRAGLWTRPSAFRGGSIEPRNGELELSVQPRLN